MSENSNDLTVLKADVLTENLNRIGFCIDKSYMSKLSHQYNLVPFDLLHNNETNTVSYKHNIRAVKVDKWVFDRDENPGKCFKNVLSSFADGDHTLALVVKRTPTDTEMYFVVKNEGEGRRLDSQTNSELLEDTITGNFQGTKVKKISKSETLEELFGFEKNISSIALLTNTPSEYSEDYVGQGLDKLLNSVVPDDEYNSYTVVFLAQSLSEETLKEILSGYEDMTTALSPFEQEQLQVGLSDTETKGENSSKSIGKSSSLANSEGINKSMSLSFGIGAWGQMTQTEGKTTSSSKTDTESDTSTTGESKSLSRGTSQSKTYTFKSYKIGNMIEKLKTTMERINKSKATGLWKFSTYIMSEKAKTTKNIANILKGITQGKSSYIEPAFIQEWTDQNPNKEKFAEIRKYLHFFTHPIFVPGGNDNGFDLAVTPTSYVATDELSYVIAFPKNSMQGLPVLQGTQFGREPHSLLNSNYDLPMGKAYHMHQVYDTPIGISSEELSKHTFVTGSTGSGKSNTIYHLLEQCTKLGKHFLVIEPAKGEYKDFLGRREDVTVFGTNPKQKGINLLKINPFSFPSDTIHILEHLDRLIEIFNICWPMYAAMPAVLKDAIEQAYKSAGWDLINSENKFDNNIFPTFSDVLREIKTVLDSSEYSAENKGNYAGALCTRLKSLTNGINGLIFSCNSIPDAELFDNNAIVDLSRVGSVETKAMVMGLLVLKLQEYRMARNQPNSGLKHITVLEEAHNLLKRASGGSGEGSGLLAKSVEMLANAIAEMRTYGEAFIIADQSPGLLDMSVIRNTNTKILLRLPDFSDRELVGRAAGLNDEQIVELGKLEKGVAVLSQNDWLEPVLCKIDKFDDPVADEKVEVADNTIETALSSDTKIREIVLKSIMGNELGINTSNKEELFELKKLVVDSNFDTLVKCDFLEWLESEPINRMPALRKLSYDFFHVPDALEKAKKCSDIKSWTKCVADNLFPSVSDFNKDELNRLMPLIVYETKNRDYMYNNIFCKLAEVYKEKGGIF